jgi:PAS domain S-box-containing protein
MTTKNEINCWEYFSCTNTSCPAHGNREQACWLIETTFCSHKETVSLENKGVVCSSCPVFQNSTDLDAIKAFVRHHYHTMVMREHLAEQTNLAFSEAFSRLVDVVEKLCHGDPAARVSVSAKNILIRKLEEGINQLAESMAERIHESHEMAIGICEHYDALNRIAAGDLSVQANERSSNELIAQLGILINKGTASLLSIIQQLQETDQQLSFAYHQMRDIIDFLPDATFVIDRQGRIIAWNKALEEMTGYAAADMIGKTQQTLSLAFYGEPRPVLLDFLDADTKQIMGHYSHVKRQGKTLSAEAHIPPRNGRGDIYLWVTAAPLIDQQGQRIGAVESVRDISDYRIAENNRSNLEAQLRQAQKMEAIGLLAGGIAHDFNNLLTAIVGYASLLQMKLGPQSDMARYPEQILISTTRASKLTQDLLAFSRKRILNPEATDLNRIILLITGLLKKLITEDIDLSINFECETLLAVVDRGMIEQVLMNLVANARDALPHGGLISIRTSIAERLEPTPGTAIRSDVRYAVIAVSDSGVGMDEQTREKIFEPFFTTKELGKGTGLGLSTVFGIVSQHEGTITVDSELGHGTTFRVYLPLLEQPAPGSEFSEGTTVCPFMSGGTETILLAEDNAETRGVNQEILTTAGYTVITADNGEEALATYRKYGNGINLVILDVIMPLKNGREVYDEICTENPAVRCLFTSGYTADIIHKKGKIEKEFDFLAKPSRPNDLLSKVREILDRP